MTQAFATSLSAVGNVLRAADLLEEVLGSKDVLLSGVCQDSRVAHPGDLFLAWEGTVSDGHDFVSEAVQRGAVASVVKRPLDVEIPQLVVSNSRRAAALAACTVMGSPDEDLLTVGVTGTNGKTTTALLIQHLIGPKVPTAVIGTLGLVDSHGVRPGSEALTTPGPVQVAKWLRELVDGGAGAVVLEASSHALAQYRLDGMSFDVVVFTNLTQDHIDYHGDIDAYFAAKTRLVELAEADATVIVNQADPAWVSLDIVGRRLRTFAVGRNEADVSATNLELYSGGSAFRLIVDGVEHQVQTPLLGRYNVENALAAVAAATAAGVTLDDVIERLGTAPQVSGRLETVVTSPFTVLIDFAHTSDALKNALSVVKPLADGKLIVVFGAGGARDPTKRRPMAQAVSAVADVIVLTSDNPRTEDPERILDDLSIGLEDVDYRRVTDRRQAIKLALAIAASGDIVVLAGKGHETYQVVGREKQAFDERQIVSDHLAGGRFST